MQTTERHGIPFRSPGRFDFEWLLVLLRTCRCSRCRRRGRARLKYGRLVGWRDQHILIIHLPVGARCPDNQLRSWLLQAARHYGLNVSSAITVTLWRGAPLRSPSSFSRRYDMSRRGRACSKATLVCSEKALGGGGALQPARGSHQM